MYIHPAEYSHTVCEYGRPTQEYLGQAKHVCHLPSQWKSYLDFDTAAPGGTASDPQTLARVVSGAGGTKPHPYAGTAAVSNLGE